MSALDWRRRPASPPPQPPHAHYGNPLRTAVRTVVSRLPVAVAKNETKARLDKKEPNSNKIAAHMQRTVSDSYGRAAFSTSS